MLQVVMTDLIHLAKLEREGFSIRQRFQREAIPHHIPNRPAATCCGCHTPQQPRQHRVVRTLISNKALIASQSRWPKPLPEDVIELAFADGWLYLSLNIPLQQVFATIQNGELPWLCPACAGYQTERNLYAPCASILADDGSIRYVPHFVGYAAQVGQPQRPAIREI